MKIQNSKELAHISDTEIDAATFVVPSYPMNLHDNRITIPSWKNHAPVLKFLEIHSAKCLFGMLLKGCEENQYTICPRLFLNGAKNADLVA